MKLFSRSFKLLAVPAAFSAIALFAHAPASLASVPATSWASRNTGLESQGACYRRARAAMQNAGLRSIDTTGDTGYEGTTSSTQAFILCQRNGSRAYVFTAGSDAVSIRRSLAVYMER